MWNAALSACSFVSFVIVLAWAFVEHYEPGEPPRVDFVVFGALALVYALSLCARRALVPVTPVRAVAHTLAVVGLAARPLSLAAMALAACSYDEARNAVSVPTERADYAREARDLGLVMSTLVVYAASRAIGACSRDRDERTRHAAAAAATAHHRRRAANANIPLERVRTKTPRGATRAHAPLSESADEEAPPPPLPLPSAPPDSDQRS